MANSISSFYQTLVAAATEASQLLAPTWKASDSIYWDYSPEAATIGQTINVPIPGDPTNNVADSGSGDIALNDINFTTVPIVFNKHPTYGFVVRDFEQFNSPTQIRNLFLDTAIKGIKNNINKAICALFTTGNFATNTAISCTSHIITVPQFLSGMAVLSDQNVPVADDPMNMSLLLPSTPYMAMLDPTTSGGGAAWSQAFIVGSNNAEAQHRTGQFSTAYGMDTKLDQQMPTTGTSPSRTFTGAYFHRWAVAGVARPLPTPDGKVVDFMYLDFNGLPLRVMMGYNQLKAGYVVTVDAGYGLKVVRPEMAQLFTIAE